LMPLLAQTGTLPPLDAPLRDLREARTTTAPWEGAGNLRPDLSKIRPDGQPRLNQGGLWACQLKPKLSPWSELRWEYQWEPRWEYPWELQWEFQWEPEVQLRATAKKRSLLASGARAPGSGGEAGFVRGRLDRRRGYARTAKARKGPFSVLISKKCHHILPKSWSLPFLLRPLRT
jgi:hypothetical protein